MTYNIYDIFWVNENAIKHKRTKNKDYNGLLPMRYETYMSLRSLERLPRLKEQYKTLQSIAKAFVAIKSANLLDDLAFQEIPQPKEESKALIHKIESLENHPKGSRAEFISFITSKASVEKHRYFHCLMETKVTAHSRDFNLASRADCALVNFVKA